MLQPSALQIQRSDEPTTRVLSLGRQVLVRIGRGPDCHVQVEEPELADVQCLLRRRGHHWIVEAFGPPGPVRLGERPISGQHRIPKDTTVTVGSTQLTISDDPAPRPKLLDFKPTLKAIPQTPPNVNRHVQAPTHTLDIEPLRPAPVPQEPFDPRREPRTVAFDRTVPPTPSNQSLPATPTTRPSVDHSLPRASKTVVPPSLNPRAPRPTQPTTPASPSRIPPRSPSVPMVEVPSTARLKPNVSRPKAVPSRTIDDRPADRHSARLNANAPIEVPKTPTIASPAIQGSTAPSAPKNDAVPPDPSNSVAPITAKVRPSTVETTRIESPKVEPPHVNGMPEPIDASMFDQLELFHEVEPDVVTVLEDDAELSLAEPDAEVEADPGSPESATVDGAQPMIAFPDVDEVEALSKPEATPEPSVEVDVPIQERAEEAPKFVGDILIDADPIEDVDDALVDDVPSDDSSILEQPVPRSESLAYAQPVEPPHDHAALERDKRDLPSTPAPPPPSTAVERESVDGAVEASRIVEETEETEGDASNREALSDPMPEPTTLGSARGSRSTREQPSTPLGNSGQTSGDSGKAKNRDSESERDPRILFRAHREVVGPSTEPAEPELIPLPSIRDVLRGQGARRSGEDRVAERRSASGRRDRRPKPTVARAPSAIPMPWVRWLVGPFVLLGALPIIGAGVGLASLWALEDRQAGQIANTLADGSGLDGEALSDLVTEPTGPTPWWRGRPRSTALRFLADQRLAVREGDLEAEREAWQHLLETRAASPLDPWLRALAVRPVSGQAPIPLSEAMGLSRDVISLTWTGHRLLDAGRDEPARTAFAEALRMAATARIVDEPEPRFFGEDNRFRRFQLPLENRIGPIIEAMSEPGLWRFDDWSAILPDHAIVWLSAARMLRYQGVSKEREALRRIVDLDKSSPPPDDPSHRGLHHAAVAEALALLEPDDLDQAIVRYERAIDAMPIRSVRRAWLCNLANLRMRQGDYDRAIADWEQARRGPGASHDAIGDRARIELGDLQSQRGPLPPQVERVSTRFDSRTRQTTTPLP